MICTQTYTLLHLHTCTMGLLSIILLIMDNFYMFFSAATEIQFVQRIRRNHIQCNANRNLLLIVHRYTHVQIKLT